MPHAGPAKTSGAHVQYVIVGWDLMPKEVLQVGVLGAPHELINVKVDHPVCQVLVLVCAMLRIESSPHGVALS